jgi:hypothetical protein
MASVSTAAYAVQPDGIMLGSGVTLLPSIKAEVENNSNIYLQDSDSEISSVITRLAPSATLEVDLGATLLGFSADFESGTYDHDTNDNYLDQTYSAKGEVDLGVKSSASFGVSLNQGHDDRGTGALEGDQATSVSEPNEYDETTVDGSFIYGADGAMLKVEGFGSVYDKSYSNNENVTEDLEYDKTTFGAALSYKISGMTRAEFKISQAEIGFSSSEAALERDGSEMRLLAGISWDITGKTTGSLLVGNSARSFDSEDLDSQSQFAWEIGASWSPRKHSTFTLSSNQSSDETTGQGNYIDRVATTLSWNHRFSSYWGVDAAYNRTSDTYVSAGDSEYSDREDTTSGISALVTYSPSRILDVEGGLTKKSRASNAPGLDYSQTIMNVSVLLAF